VALNTFGVTAALLQSDLLPHYAFNATSSPTATAVGTIVTRLAARLCGHIQHRGLDPAGIDATGEPLAFYNCQALLLAGVASHVARAFTGKKTAEGLVESWRAEWEEGLKRLATEVGAKEILADALSRSSHSGYVHSHVHAGSDRPTTVGDIEIDDPEFVRDMDL